MATTATNAKLQEKAEVVRQVLATGTKVEDQLTTPVGLQLHRQQQQQRPQHMEKQTHFFSMSKEEYDNKIDNSQNVYIPIKLQVECAFSVCSSNGIESEMDSITLMCRPEVLSNCPSVVNTIHYDIQQCFYTMPKSVHKLICKTKIWINLANYIYGPKNKVQHLRHSTAHHHEAWLIWARDLPDKAHGIEIYNSYDYLRMRLHWNGCGLIMHELCHLIHQFMVPNGLDNLIIKKAYADASNSGLYDDNILRRDWAGKQQDYDMAYAMVNHKEFFAEMSVAYLCDNYNYLDHSNKNIMELCCPPLMEPSVIQRVEMAKHKQKHEQAQQQSEHQYDGEKEKLLLGSPIPMLNNNDDDVRNINDKSCNRGSYTCRGIRLLLRGLLCVSALRFCDFVMDCFFSTSKQRTKPSVLPPPCNKFYPFTRGQLKVYDPNLYNIISHMWEDIKTRNGGDK